MNKIFRKLRHYNRKNYHLLIFCICFAVALITSFGIIFLGPTVQSVLPEGGDSNKMGIMVYLIAILGSLMFIIYASGLFFRHKSRETGVFLALGAAKKQLIRALYTELTVITTGCVAAGLVFGMAVSFGIWQIFRLALGEHRQMEFHMGSTGILVGLLFGVVAAVCIFLKARGFMRRTNLIDILNEARKNEPVPKVKNWYGVLGIFLIAGGVVLGYGVPKIVSEFGYLMPGIWNAVYLLAAVGVYLFLLHTIMHHKRGRNPVRYYRNIISYGMMKFQGRQTVRNLCVITFLLAASLFGFFYLPTYSVGALSQGSVLPVDFSFTYYETENPLPRERIEELAGEYHMDITDYREIEFTELLASGVERDWSDDNTLIENYIEKDKYAQFISVSAFNQLTGNSLSVEQGTYLNLLPEQVESTFWVHADDMDLVTNPVTDTALSLRYAGSNHTSELVSNSFDRYILNDEDFASITRETDPEHIIRQSLFNVAEPEESYEFASALYREFLSNCGPRMNVSYLYDEYQEQQALQNKEEYYYTERMEMSPDNPDLAGYWKFYPNIKILMREQMLSSLMVYLVLFSYLGIICLAAVSIISYTRAVTIGLSNRQLFEDLRKLGANHSYINRCIRTQLKKIFIFPTLIGGFAVYATFLLIMTGNDGKITPDEQTASFINLVILAALALYQFLLYHISRKKIEKLIF